MTLLARKLFPVRCVFRLLEKTLWRTIRPACVLLNFEWDLRPRRKEKKPLSVFHRIFYTTLLVGFHIEIHLKGGVGAKKKYNHLIKVRVHSVYEYVLSTDCPPGTSVGTRHQVLLNVICYAHRMARELRAAMVTFSSFSATNYINNSFPLNKISKYKRIRKFTPARYFSASCAKNYITRNRLVVFFIFS